jgi:nitrite reductase/ring-hydroxylating ferredoxin subunit
MPGCGGRPPTPRVWPAMPSRAILALSQRTERAVEQGGQSHVVARADALAPGEVKRVEIDGRGIALFNLGGTFYALNDMCTHMRARLSDGYVEGDIVECPLHFGKFNIRTGKASSPPCTIDVRTYTVEREGDSVRIVLPGG